jgi:hypothetical protein
MKTFEWYKENFEGLNNDGDVEGNHISADSILKMLCFDIAKGNGFTLNQVNILIELYDKIEKWYA